MEELRGDPVAVLEAMQEIPKPEIIPPWWVLHILWPITRIVRRFHRWTQAQDNRVKLVICRWLGVLDAVAQERQLLNGQRRDLDRVAKTVGELIPEFNKNQSIVADLRILNHTALLRLQNSRKREKENNS
jgi:hypothetical protein